MVHINEDGEELDNLVLDFLKHAYSNGSFPPDQFFYQDELEKLRFSTTGTLKYNSENLLSFLIGNFFIFHCFIENILYASDNFFPKIDPYSKTVFKDLGAFLYYSYTVRNLESNDDYLNNQDSIKLGSRDIIANTGEKPKYRIPI